MIRVGYCAIRHHDTPVINTIGENATTTPHHITTAAFIIHDHSLVFSNSPLHSLLRLFWCSSRTQYTRLPGGTTFRAPLLHNSRPAGSTLSLESLCDAGVSSRFLLLLERFLGAGEDEGSFFPFPFFV
jgi:hypothetical protein